MGYELRAVIADGALLREVAGHISAARLVPLHGNLSLLPMTEEFHDAVTDGSDGRPMDFWGLPSGFDRELARWSATGSVGYVESEYFGGAGEEQAVVWSNGVVALGPLYLPEGSAPPAGGGPVSQVLRHLGVRKGSAFDEFEAAGLDRRRRTDEWGSPARK
jgi:hypothetical protein